MSEFSNVCSDFQSQADTSREEKEIYAGYFANDIEAFFSRPDASQVVQPLYEDPPIPWNRLTPILGTLFQDVFHDWDSFQALYQTLDLRVAKPTSLRKLAQLPAAVHTRTGSIHILYKDNCKQIGMQNCRVPPCPAISISYLSTRRRNDRFKCLLPA